MSKKPLTAEAATPSEAPALPVLSPEQAQMLLALRAKTLNATISGGELTVGGVTHRARLEDGVVVLASEASVSAVGILRDELLAAEKQLTAATSRRKWVEASYANGNDELADEVKSLASTTQELQEKASALRQSLAEKSVESRLEFPLGGELRFEVRA